MRAETVLFVGEGCLLGLFQDSFETRVTLRLDLCHLRLVCVMGNADVDVDLALAHTQLNLLGAACSGRSTVVTATRHGKRPVWSLPCDLCNRDADIGSTDRMIYSATLSMTVAHRVQPHARACPGPPVVAAVHAQRDPTRLRENDG